MVASSLMRSLTASFRLNLTSVKAQARRIKRSSQDLFGQDLPLSTCQEVIARSHGFQHWSEAAKVLGRSGFDREAPPWILDGRSNSHEAILEALYGFGLELSETAPLVFLGSAEEAVRYPLVLLLESMSYRRVVGTAAAALGVTDLIGTFRTLDLREPNLPVSISTSARGWAEAFVGILPWRESENLRGQDWVHLVESEMNALGFRGTEDREDVDFSKMARVLNRVINARGLKVPETIRSTWNDLHNRRFGLGLIIAQESRRRPVVALFDRDDPSSVVLAGVLHSLFHERYIKGREYRPILYASDGENSYAPSFLAFGTHTATVNGVREMPKGNDLWMGYGTGLAVYATKDSLQFSGRRVTIA
jgi:hypothetical protein